ncbi:uncharacterized protein N7496_000318 [Penicillium cataractarum]|uniref:Ig-like domain-containing protein n=1 Tax=Penicillium cataractarum TaxID=2100454 RepID=A0A9W9VU31_9EURO|nr:uncharacterized protein N7496_000318 [Penicillium cataractarum]KAJ5389250.1 hypothetical protein N7496_000318 [Penicillium cataractarum]
MRITFIVITVIFAFLSAEATPHHSIAVPKSSHIPAKATPLDGFIAVPKSTSTSISCSEVGDPTVDSATRWQKSGADNALIKAIQYYHNQSSQAGSQTFSRAVSHYFNGPENYDCQLVDSPCNAGVSKCETVTSPAGWLILNSFANFHNLWSNVNTALKDAEADITPQLGTFTSTFAPPVKDNSEMEKILFDISNILLSVLNAYVGFEAGFVENKVLGNGIDKGTSAFVGILSGVQTIGKDLLPAAEQEQINEGQLGTALSEITNAMQKIYSLMVADFSEKGIFDSASPAINVEELFFNGTWVNSTLSTIDNRDLKIDFEHALYGLLAERAWRLTSELYPTVVVPEYLPGGDTNTLTGDSGTWGGLTIDDIAISSYTGFMANGGQPGYQMPNTTNIIDNGQINTNPFPLQDGVRTPGFFNIPTCTFDTMFSMLETKDVRQPKYFHLYDAANIVSSLLTTTVVPIGLVNPETCSSYAPTHRKIVSV